MAARFTFVVRKRTLVDFRQQRTNRVGRAGKDVGCASIAASCGVGWWRHAAQRSVPVGGRAGGGDAFDLSFDLRHALGEAVEVGGVEHEQVDGRERRHSG